ncbi:MAG: YbaN family protein [Lachnospiraceae bacterium]|nr:YbaN family protein [Lachnospiraceae bacterium]
MNIKKIVFIVVGCICLALGTVGVVLPILPTVPFYLVTVYCFTRSSEKLDNWFKGTKLYKKHLESYVKKEGMLVSTKVGIICSVTLLMGLGFFFMARKAIWVPCIILGVVWIAHVIYFIFGVKTISSEKVVEEAN